MGPATAQTDTDGDGLSDAEEVSRAKTVPFGAQQVITANADGSISAVAADLDGDGDNDVLASIWDESKIAWYENRLNEASADFGPQQVITATVYAVSAVASDLDGDGDADVLAVNIGGGGTAGGVGWWENRLDEVSADFGPRQVIGQESGASVLGADLDGDGDPDVLWGSYDPHGDGKIAWYENRLDEASVDFGPQQVIATEGNSVFAADFDGDGDSDVLSASEWDDKIPWHENRLNEPAHGDFGPTQLIAQAGHEIFAADFDQDGDPDVLSGCCPMGWSENRLDEASEDFGPLQVITTATQPSTSVFASDLDGDGDPDVLSAHYSDKIAWYENRLDEASADFGPQQVITLSDGDEVNVHATDPLDPDSDGDGLSDGFEVTSGFDPLLGGEESQDTDFDGLDNLAEQAAGTSPLDPDSDGDRLSDGDEVNVHATDPLDPDSDGDGIFDDLEISAGSNPNDPGDFPAAGIALPDVL